MSRMDFMQRTIAAGDWAPIEKARKPAEDPCPHWIPVSTRARAMFGAAAFRTSDKKLTGLVRHIFCANRLALSYIDEYCGSFIQVGSRLEDKALLEDLLQGWERVISWGHKKGFFRHIMSPKPSYMEYWSYINFIAESNANDGPKIVVPFVNALESSMEDYLSLSRLSKSL